MISDFVDRIKNMAPMVASFAIVAVTAFQFGRTQRMPEARAAVDRQVNIELAQERLAACEMSGKRAGTDEHTTCIAELKEMRAKHNNRQAEDTGTRRDGLPIVF
jgi:hypothetical protein